MNFHSFTASVAFKVCLDETSILIHSSRGTLQFYFIPLVGHSNGTSFTYGKPFMRHFILAGLYFNHNFIPHGNFFIHLWVLFHSLPTALSYNISFMYGRYFIATSIPRGNLIILPWTLFHSSPAATSCDILFTYGRYFIATSIPHGNLIILSCDLLYSSP